MRWTTDHDVALVREIILHEPWEKWQGSVERGKSWENIAASLNGLTEIHFKVTQRSVRDHYKVLVDAFKKKEREEKNASGISPEESEVVQALADIVERFEQSDDDYKKQSEEKKNKAAADTAKATEMRKRSLETFAETNVRADKEPTKKQRNCGSETINYLKEKAETEMHLRREELELKREETETAKAQAILNNQLQQTMAQAMQQQQQMNATLMQAQQQQQAALIALIEKLAK